MYDLTMRWYVWTIYVQMSLSMCSLNRSTFTTLAYMLCMIWLCVWYVWPVLICWLCVWLCDFYTLAYMLCMIWVCAAHLCLSMLWIIMYCCFIMCWLCCEWLVFDYIWIMRLLCIDRWLLVDYVFTIYSLTYHIAIYYTYNMSDTNMRGS